MLLLASHYDAEYISQNSHTDLSAHTKPFCLEQWEACSLHMLIWKYAARAHLGIWGGSEEFLEVLKCYVGGH